MNRVLSKVLMMLMVLTLVLPVVSPSVFAGDKYEVTQDADDFGVKFENGKIVKGGAYMEEEGQEGVWNKIFGEYKGIITGITGIGTLTMVVLFIFNFMKLGQSAGNPQLRGQALTGLLWTGLAAAGLGGVTIFVGFSQNLLRNK